MRTVKVYPTFGEEITFEGEGIVFDGMNKFFVVLDNAEKKHVLKMFRKSKNHALFYEFEDLPDIYNSCKLRRYLLWWRSLEDGHKPYLTEANGDILEIEIE